MRRMRRRVLFFFVMLLLGIGLLFGILTTRSGSDILIGLVNRLIYIQGGGPIVHADLALDFWDAAVVVENLSLDFPQRGYIEADSIRIVFQPFQLLRNRLTIESIEVQKPRLNWDLFAKRPLGSPGENDPDYDRFDLPFTLIINKLIVSKGEVVLQAGNEAPSELNGINLRADYQDGGYALRMETGSGAIRFQDIVAPINLIHARAQYADQALTVQKLRLFLPEVDLQFEGDYQHSDNRQARFHIDLALPLERLSTTLPDLPKLRGQTKLSASFSGSLSNPRVNGTLELRDGWIEDRPLEDADIRFVADRQEVQLKGSEFRYAQGTITVENGRIAFDDALSTAISLKLDHVELGHILDNVSPLHSKVTQNQTGTIEMAGVLNPLNLSGKADLTVTDHVVSSVGFHERTEEDIILVVPKGRLKLGLKADRNAFDITNGEVWFGETYFNTVYVHFGFDNQFDYKFASDQFSIADVGQLLHTDFSGRGSLYCEMHGASGNPHLDGWLDMHEVEIEGHRFGHVTSKVAFQGHDLAFNDATATYNRTIFHADVAFDFRQKPTFVDVRGGSDGFYVDDFLQIIHYDRSLSPILDGRMVGTGVLSGQFGDFRGEARIVLPEFSTPQQTFNSAKIEMRLENKDLEFRQVELKNGNAQLFLNGFIHDYRDLDMRIHSSGWQVRDIDFLRDYFGDSDSPAEASGKLLGTFDDPILQAQVLLDPMNLDGKTYEASELHFELSKRYLDINGQLFNHQADYSALFQFDATDRLDLSLRLDEFDPSFYLRKQFEAPLEKSIFSGKIDFKGPMYKLADGTGLARITTLDAELGKIPVTITSPLTIELEKQLFKLEPVMVEGPQTKLQVRGNMDVNGRVEALLKGTAHWSLLTRISDAVQDAQGQVQLNLSLSGKLNDLSILGEAAFQQSRFKLSMLDEPLRGCRGTVLFSADQLELRDVSFNYGGGQAVLNGHTEIDWVNEGMGKTDIRMNVDRIGYRLDDGLLPILSGPLHITGEPWPLNVSGRLNVDDLTYTKSIRWQKQLILDRVVQALKPRKAWHTEKPDPHLTFNIDLKGDRTIQVRNNLASLFLTSDLVLTGTNQQPGLLNTLSTDRGTIYFEHNEFDVIRFVVEFTDTNAIVPRYDIVAETHVKYIDTNQERDVLITLHLSGDMDNPEVKLSSDAGLPQADIVSLLLVGQPTSKSQNDATAAAGLNALSDIYGVDDQIRTQFKLDEFRLTSEYDNSNPSNGGSLVSKLVIGKEITDKVYLTYTTTLGIQQQRGDQQFELKYRLKYFTLSGAWDNDSLEPYGNFGADLKFHLDF